MTVSWPVHTARLSIRPATPDDAAATWEYRKLPGVAMWMTTSPSSFEEYADLWGQADRMSKTFIMERDGTIVGDLMIAVEDAWGQTEIKEQAEKTQAELGWCLTPEAEGQGLATEAVRELFRICFEGLGLRRVTAVCFTANDPSWRLMERVGMRREAHNVKDALHRSGEWMDGYLYALLAEEWRARGSESGGVARGGPGLA